MIPEHLYPTWRAIGATLGNHLWQSTLFAIVAGLLTLALRNNPARVRYWLWLAAAAKFLIPFSLLIGVGSHLAFHEKAGPCQADFDLLFLNSPFPSWRRVCRAARSGQGRVLGGAANP
jgi:ABC-type Fe3+ transport system permease subunit